jgi:Domain of unknown function (DUF4440)
MGKIGTLCLFFMMLQLLVSGQSAAEKKLVKNIETFHRAMIDANRSTLENLVTTDLSYGHSNAKVENKTEFVEVIVSGKNDFKSITISGQSISIAGNVAIVRHIFNGEILIDGNMVTPKIGVMMVWVKQKQTWQLLARQAFKI